ncbi:MAG: NAD(P)-dependent oxidoreductase [Betaproteobacteria bacterium]|nr:NAD(P)-dependent oxidoreductase [Betaproteobacteria bacterium]
MTQRPLPVGVIGTGLMGTACAKRLLAAGFGVLGYDVDAGKLKSLAAQGGRAADSVAAIARECSQVVLAVFNTDQVEDAIEGPRGLLAGRPAEAGPVTVICVSTCDPDRIAALAARLPGERLRFVEAPVSGTSDQTARGEALGLVGGDPAAVEAARGVLEAICPRWHHIGPAGSGGRAKLAINLILGINRAALAEGLVFAERMGLDPGAFLEVARESAAYSQIMDVKGRKMLACDFSPQGYVTQSLKDFSLMLEQARRLKQRLPLGETYRSLMEGCVAAGEGGLDNSAVIREIRRRTA